MAQRRTQLVRHLVRGSLICLALFVLGCTRKTDRDELPPAEQVQAYQGRWEYRYGESPRDSNGAFLWADPSNHDAQWQPTTELNTPPSTGNKGNLWLRTRLEGPPLADPTLFLTGVDQSLEGYLNGRRIAQFGPMDDASVRRFFAKRPLYLPLGDDDYAGQTLVLRFKSSWANIGILGIPQLGGKAELLVYVMKRGLPFIIVGALFIVLGIGILIFYALDRSQALYLLYGAGLLFIGLFELSRSDMRALFIEEPVFWRCLELTMLCLMAASTCAFVARLFDSKPAQVLRWLSLIFVAYFIAGSLLILSGFAHLEDALRPVLILWLIFIVAFLAVALHGAWRGNTDARILACGFIISAGLATNNLLSSLHILPEAIETRHLSALVLGLTLGAILARRFRAFNKRLTDYSTVLQLSFSSAQDLAPGQHAQIALAELLRMLGAERALLFLGKADSEELDLVAGRDARGNVMLDPVSQGAHDEKLVDAVHKKRRPLIHEQVLPAPKDDGKEERRSVVATPLMARGQFLGVLYLEADVTRHIFGREDVEILLGLGSQVALTLMATRAGKLESESVKAQERLKEQGALLEAAARMARGDLKSPIAVTESSELAPLAEALDVMRRDLLAKIHMLESSNAEVKELNEELRYQIDQRLRRLMEKDRLLEAGTGEKKRSAGLMAGDLLGDQYQVVALRGEGSSGSVYEVERITDGRHFAAKVLNNRSDKTVSIRFAREAQILARLTHPNVISIVDIDLTADGILYLIMELVRGVPLSRCQERFGDRAFALTVLQQIASGLRIVHERGIVHRDLKPANVLISEVDGRPHVKLVDFGGSTLSLAKAQKGNAQEAFTLSNLPEDQQTKPGQLADHLTGAGILIGTPMYAAPELVEGSRKARPPSDIFSFGVIAYELLSDEMPFTQPPVAARFRGETLQIPSLHDKCKDVPQALTTLIERCLDLDPARRPTIEEIVTVLDAAQK